MGRDCKLGTARAIPRAGHVDGVKPSDEAHSQDVVLWDRAMKNSALVKESASALIDRRIEELGDWRGKTLKRIRKLIKQADPEIIEEWKWMGTPVWSHAGIVCTGETYKSVVKMTFAKGASLQDPAHLFNSSLEGNVRRAIDIRQDDNINEPALKALIRAAIALNLKSKQRG